MRTPAAIADELMAAYAARRTDVQPPSTGEASFDLSAGYAVEAEVVGRRRASGRTTVGLKVAFANSAMWRVLNVDTVAWAHMYDDTVSHAEHGRASLSLSRMASPKIEPEIVLALKSPVPPGTTDAAAVLEHVEWIALGFEIIDCVYANWTFQPADFVASHGLHAALVVGEPLRVTADHIPALADALAACTASLERGGQVVAEGGGKNVLRSPALCLAELASAIARRAGAASLDAGALISSGTLTQSQPIVPGEQWTARVDGLGLASLTLTLSA